MRIFHVRVTRSMVQRAVVDCMAVQLSFLAAYVMRLMILGFSYPEESLSPLIDTFILSFLKSFLLVGVVLLAAFVIGGFYTGGRMVKSFRLFWIMLVVAVGYGIFAGFAFLLNNWFQIPRGIIPLGWLFTLVSISGLRVATTMRVFNVRVTRPMLLRAAADCVVVQVAFLFAYGMRLVILNFSFSDEPLLPLVYTFASSYLRSFLLVGGVMLAAFSIAGFYTSGRMYRSFRFFWVSLVVAVGYGIFAGFAFLLNNWFQIPRGVFPLGWFFTLVAIAGMRVASTTWASVLKAEGRLLGRPEPQDHRVNSVLVIGGAGYIGSALIPRLLKGGYNVRILDLLLWGTDPIGEWIDHPKLEVVKADLRQIDKIVESMRGMEAVIHLGGIVGDPACSLDEDLTIDVNLAATRLIGEIARGEGVQRVLFASTCSVYGSGTDLLSETSATTPLSLYAKTKLASEQVLMDMRDHEFAPVIFRFGTIFGFSGRTRFDLVVNLLTAKAVQEGKITVFGGDQWRPFVHVDDAARAVFMLLEAPLETVRGEVFNVGSDAGNLTIQQVAEVVKLVVPDAEIVNMGGDTDKRNYRGDFRKINRAIGFEARWSVEDGVRQIEKVLRAGKISDYTESRFSNVRFLNEASEGTMAQPTTGWPVTLLEEQQVASSPVGVGPVVASPQATEET